MQPPPDMSGAPPSPAPDPNQAKKPSSGLYVTVPLASLAMPGEDEIMNNPGMGDTVQFHAEGKVDKIDGDNAVVCIDAVNGKPVSDQASKVNDTPQQGADEQYAQLQSDASQMPRM
jgi:hypothetical protein